MRARTHTHIHTHTYAHTYTHTHHLLAPQRQGVTLATPGITVCTVLLLNRAQLQKWAEGWLREFVQLCFCAG
jgi:hypothetical protein